MSEELRLLPENECVRLNRTEMNAARWCLAALNSIAYAHDDLSKRLELIPDGVDRWASMEDQLRGLMNDIIGTVPTKQCVTIRNVMNDMELRMVPKFTPTGDRVSMGVDDLAYLVRETQSNVCTACSCTDNESRTCELYKILEGIAPREDYGSGTMCPYSTDEWMEG